VSQARALRIGIRAHDFGKLPAEELAARIAAKGLCCVQLAVSKAIAGLDLKAGDFSPGLGYAIGRAFFDRGVQIAVLGCYINLSHPDATARAALMRLFKEHLRYARDFGCSIVATETGSLNPDWSFHPDNRTEAAFESLIPTVAELVAEAERFGVVFGIEGVASHVLNSPQRIRRLLDAVGSNNLQVVFDPVNLLSIENFQNQDRIVEESFDLFGDRMAIIHAKDFQPEGNSLKQVRTGQGQFNYPLFLKLLCSRKPYISILLEEASEPTADACIGYLERIADGLIR
jgi:sugar phosphate isomerase/epimerase